MVQTHNTVLRWLQSKGWDLVDPTEDLGRGSRRTIFLRCAADHRGFPQDAKFVVNYIRQACRNKTNLRCEGCGLIHNHSTAGFDLHHNDTRRICLVCQLWYNYQVTYEGLKYGDLDKQYILPCYCQLEIKDKEKQLYQTIQSQVNDQNHRLAPANAWGITRMFRECHLGGVFADHKTDIVIEAKGKTIPKDETQSLPACAGSSDAPSDTSHKDAGSEEPTHPETADLQALALEEALDPEALAFKKGSDSEASEEASDSEAPASEEGSDDSNSEEAPNFNKLFFLIEVDGEEHFNPNLPQYMDDPVQAACVTKQARAFNQPVVSIRVDDSLYVGNLHLVVEKIKEIITQHSSGAQGYDMTHYFITEKGDTTKYQHVANSLMDQNQFKYGYFHP